MYSAEEFFYRLNELNTEVGALPIVPIASLKQVSLGFGPDNERQH
jgi:hypothetical protein